ncbi:MAG: hypothetical protein AAF871_12755 [Pseudomonadota bacterium]
MAEPLDAKDIDRLLVRIGSGEPGAVLGLMRAVRSDELGRVEEARIVDAIYAARDQFRSRRVQFALALLCSRTGSRARSRAILLELVAADYAPALHSLGCDLVDNGRASAGLRLLELAKDSGYRLGDVAYWRYQAKVARGPRRGWVAVRIITARLGQIGRRPTPEELDIRFWLPE